MMIKLIHISCALLSISGFLGRSTLKFIAPQYLQQPWLKIAPHIIDTILLTTAIILVLQIHQYPFVNSWLTAKVSSLFIYIGFGLYTLRFAHTRAQSAFGLIGACLSFSYIMLVALTQQAWPL